MNPTFNTDLSITFKGERKSKTIRFTAEAYDWLRSMYAADQANGTDTFTKLANNLIG